MKYHKEEIRDFKCRLCGANWLSYIENKNSCNNSSLGDGRHNFDFGKPIKKGHDVIESSETADSAYPKNKIVLQ
jgi:hypothetical protein